MARLWHGHYLGFLGIRPGCPRQTADGQAWRMLRSQGLRCQTWHRETPKGKLRLIHAIDTTDCFAVARVWGPDHVGPKALYNLRDINRARPVKCLTSVSRRSFIPLHRVLKDLRRLCLANHVEWRVYSADRCKHQHIRLDAI